MSSTRISRKEFLGISAGAAAGVALAGSGLATFLTKEAQAATPALTPFVDALPIPPLLTGAAQNLRIRQTTTHNFHRALPDSRVWGYNGGGYDGYLGPTIEAVKGTPTTVSYVNELPTTHLLKVDPTITQMKGKPQNSRILTHLHGGHISATADGNPFASNDIQPGQTQTVTYANDQEAAHIWYHDHAMGITRLNVMAGLAGHYLVRDAVDDGKGGVFPNEPGTGLPYGEIYEVPLAIQDRTFTKDGQLDYPANWTPEFFGDVVTVNGRVWPYLTVEPRKYRFRILNGSNSRFYNLRLSNGRAIFQIGTDGGLLPRPVQRSRLLLAPGERADVVIDFTGLSGTNVRLVDSALPATTISPATPLQRPEIMRFNVRGTATVADKPLPTRLRTTSFSVPGAIAKTRFLTLEEVLAGPVPTAVVLNGMGFLDRPVTEDPRLGKSEIWNIINISADTHPIHLHLVQFQVLGRQTIDVAKYQAALDAARASAGGPVDAGGELVNPDPTKIPGCITGPAPVEANERGPKDTVRANPGQVTRIKANFDLAGEYVWHCHILEHEDNDMMRPYQVKAI
jgi:spore coat protein A